MKKTLHWLDENLEEFILVIFLIAMTLIMGIQVLCRYVLGMSLSWSEELTRYLFIWCGFLSVRLQQEMPVDQDRTVCCNFPTQRQGDLQGCEPHLRTHLLYLHDPVCLVLYDVFCAQRTAFPGLRHPDVLHSGGSVRIFHPGRIPRPAALDHRVPRSKR